MNCDSSRWGMFSCRTFEIMVPIRIHITLHSAAWFNWLRTHLCIASTWIRFKWSNLMWVHFVIDFACKAKPKYWLSSEKIHSSIRTHTLRDIIMKYLIFTDCHKNKLSSLFLFRHRIMNSGCNFFLFTWLPVIGFIIHVHRSWIVMFVVSVVICFHLCVSTCCFTATWCVGNFFVSGRESRKKMCATMGKQAIILIYCDQLVYWHLTTINWRGMQDSWYRWFQRAEDRTEWSKLCAQNWPFILLEVILAWKKYLRCTSRNFQLKSRPHINRRNMCVSI